MHQIWVIYPFTSQAIGADDNYVIHSNSSNAFFVVLRRLQKEMAIRVRAIYMTSAKIAHEVEQEGIEFQFLPVTIDPKQGHASFGRQWSLSIVWKLFTERPRLVFLFIGGGWFAIFLALVCRILSIPYCPIIAGWGVSTRRSQRWYYRNALHVIVHTNKHKELFRNNGIDVDRFLVMPMGVDTDLFLFKPVTSVEINNRKLQFIYAGRLEPTKNLLGALKVFAKIKERYPFVHFDVVGPTSSLEYYQEALAFISENGLGDNVNFHGFVPNNEMPDLYSKADIMLFPTLSESFGFVLAESMACGTPVVALSGKGSPDEIIEDGVDGILAKDENDLTLRILELLGNPERLKAMGRAARDKVERLYSVNRTYAQLVDLLKETEAPR